MQRNNRRKEYTIADMIPFASDYWTNGEGAAYDVGNMLGSSAVLGAETAAIAATGGAALGALGVGGAGAAAAARGAGLAGRALAGARVGAFVSNGAVGGLAIGGGNTVMRAGANRLDAREEEAEPPINNPNEQSVQRPKPVAVQAQEYLDELYDNENLTDDQRNEIGTAADSEDANAVLQTATKYGWQNPTQQQQDSQGQSAINAQSTTEEQLTAANGAVNAAVNNVANGGAVVGNMNANGEVAQVDNGAAAEQAVAADNAAVQQQENEQLQQLQGQVAVAEEIPAIKLNGKEVRPQFIEGGKRISFKAPGFGKKASATEKADYQKAGFKWDSKLQAHVADNTEESRAFLQKYNKENVENANASSQNAEQQEDNDNASDADKIDKHGYFVQVGDFVTDESKKNTKNVHYYVLKDGVASNGVVAACVRREYQEENIADYVYTVVFFGEHKTEKTIRGLHGLGEVDKALKGYKKIKFGKANAGASEGAKNAKKFPLRNKLGGWEIDVNASTAHTLVYHPTDADSKLSRAEVLVDKDGDGFDIQFREKNGHLVEGADYWFDTVEEAEEFLKTFDERNLELEGEKNESESSTKSEQDSVQNEQSETVEQSEADDNQDKGDNGKAKEVTGKPKNDKAEEAATIDNVAEKYPEAKDSRGVLKALKGIKAEDRPAAKEYNSKLMKKIIDDILQQCDEGKITVTKALEEIQKLIGAYTDSKPFAPLAADDNHAASYGVKEYMREAKVKLKEKAEVEAANKKAKRANAIAEAQKTTQAIIDVFKVNAAKTLQEVQKEIEDVKSKLEAALKELGVKPLTANERKSVYDSKLKVANAMQTSREVAAEAAWQKEIRDKEKAEAAEVEKARKEKQKAEKADKQETQVEEDSPAKMKQEVKARVNEAVALAEEAAYGNKETGEVDQEKKNEYDEKIKELVKPNRKYPKELADIIANLQEFTKKIVPKTYYRYFRPASELEKAAFELAPEGVYNEALSAEDINLDALGLELDEQAKEDVAVNGVVEAVLDDYGNEPDEATAVKEMLEEAKGTEGFEVSKAVAKRLQEVLKKREAIYDKYYGPLDTAREALKGAMIKAGLNPPKSLDLVKYSVTALRQRGEELRRSRDEVVSNIKKLFAGSKFEEQENGDLLIITKNGRKILYKITDRIVLNDIKTQKARKAHAISDNAEVTVEGRYRPIYEADIDAVIEVALGSRNNTETHEATHAVIDLALGKEGAKPLFDRASQLAEEYGLKADSEELACNAVRDWIVARENGFITTFTADEVANLKKSLWGRALIKVNKMGAEAKVFNDKNEAELKKTTWGKMLLAKMQIQRGAAKLMRAIYDFYKKFQAVRNSNESFHNLARKIASGEVWGEKPNKGRTGDGYKYQSVLRNAPDTFLNDKQKQTYKEDGENFIKDLYDNKVPPTSYIKMTSSPLILQKLGYSSDDIVMLKSKALTAMKPDGSEPHAHGLTDKMMAKTAMALHEPIFVMQSKTRPNDSIVVFTEIKDEKERSIIVPVQITKNKNGIANVATSEYGRTNEEIFIAKQFTDGRILYANSKKGPAWAEPTRLRLPLGLLKQSLNLEQSIAQDSQKNKPQYSIRQTPMGQALYQAAWHGTPAIIEGNLTTKRIGEGEGAIAHGWGLYFAKTREVSQVNYRERLTQSQGLEPTGKVSITDNETGKKYSWDIEDIDAGYDIVHQEYLSAVTDQAIRYFLEARGNLRRAIDFAEDAVASRKAFLEEWKNKKPSSDEEVRKYKEAKKAEEDAILSLDNFDFDSLINAVKQQERSQHHSSNFEAFSAEDIAEEVRALKESLREDEAILEAVKSIDFSEVKQPGELLLVELPENDVLLDEQRSFEKQPLKVRKALESIFDELGLPIDLEDTGGKIYEKLARALTSSDSMVVVDWNAAKHASMKLSQNGIKGIRYEGALDGECFVIWDDNAIEIKQHYDAAIRKHKQEFERSYDEIVSKVKQMFGSEAKIKQLQNNDLEVTTGNGKKFLVKVSDKVLVSEAELKRARSEHGFKDSGEVTVEGKFLPLEDSAYDGIIEVSKESRKNTEAHEITHAVVRFALDDKESDILYKRAEQIAKEYGLTANAEEVAADAIRNFVSAREHGYVTDFTKSEIAKLNKTSWGRMMLRANRLGRKAALFTKLNEERLSKSAWGRLVLAKTKLQRAVAKLFRKIYDSFKRWQALSKSIGSFHDLARRIELGEVWNEKNLDKTTKNSGIIKKNGAENGGVADGNDGRGQEDLRGTAGRVQGRQVGFGDNRGESRVPQARYEGIKGNVRGVLTEKQNSAYEGINPTIHADEWQEASGDLQGFSNALNEARAANKHGAFVDGKSPEKLQGAKVAITTDGLAGCAVEDDGNITAVFKHPSKKAPGAVRSIITMARAMGGTKMDCFGDKLLNMYERLGYKVVARIPFTDKYIEKHDDGTAVNPEEQILLDERPDVYVLMTNGDDFATATQKIKNGEYKVSTQEELDALPVFEQLSEDDDNYTRALNYRDGLLKKQQKGRAQYSIRQKSTAQDPGITGINSQYKDELEKAYAEGANNNKIAAIMNAHQQALSEYMQQAGEAKRERNKIRAAQLRQDRKDFKEGKIDSYTVGGVTIIRGKDGAEVVKEVAAKLPTRKYTNERHANEKPANATQKFGAVIARPEEKSTVQKAKGWITELKDNFYKHWVDKYDALSILDGAIADADGKPRNPADTILGRTQMVTNAASGAARALIDGDEQMLRQLAGKYKIKNMVSLQMLMEKIGAARDAGKFADYVKSSNTAGSTSLQSYIDAVENYLVARSALESAQNHRLDYDRAVAEWEEKGGRGKKPEFKEYKFPGGMTEAEVVSVIRSAPAEFKEYAKMFKGITDNMLDVLYNSGLITGERYLAIKDRYKAYCPLMRDFSDTAAVDSFIDQINGGKGIGNVSDPLKNRSSEGSERDIVPPLATIIKSINALTMKAERNRVGQYAVRQAKKHRLDNYIKEVEGSSGDSKNCIFTVVIDGKKHSYQTIPELYPAITAAVEPLMKVEMTLLTKPAQLLRTGSTMSPSFIIRNFLRDTLFAAVSTKNGFVPIYDSIRGAYALLHNKQLRGEFMSSGVVSSNFYGDGESIMRNLNDMAGGRKWEELSAWEIVKAVLGKPIQGLEWTSNLIEQSTRMGEFMRAREKGKNVEQAAYDAVEITLNFNRSGATGQQINRMVPFFNACIQGGDKLYRLFKADPKTTLLRIGVYMVLPSLVLWLMNHDEDWYKELDPNIKMQNWILPGGIRIPKPQEAGVLFGSGFEAALDTANGQDPKAMKIWSKAVLENLAPGIFPTLILPLLEWQANYSFFRGKPVVSKSQERLPDELQYGPYTSEASKAVGSVTGLSPAKLDNLWRGYTGTMGMALWQAPDLLVAEKRNLPEKKLSEMAVVRDFVINDMNLNRTMNDFYALSQAATQWQAGYGKKGKPTVEVSGINTAARTIAKLQKEARDITSSPKYNSAQKRILVDKLQAKQRKIAELCIKKYGGKFNY